MSNITDTEILIAPIAKKKNTDKEEINIEETDIINSEFYNKDYWEKRLSELRRLFIETLQEED